MKFQFILVVIYSQLSQRSTARGFCTGLVPVGPTIIKACKSILFTKGTPEVEINKVQGLLVYSILKNIVV